MINARRLTKLYKIGSTEISALDGMDFDVDDGEFVVILGPSGAGKTTLLNLIGGMDVPTSGQLIVGGDDISSFDKKRLTEYRRTRVGLTDLLLASKILKTDMTSSLKSND